jgi:DNA polymerase-3 subunit epsilon
MEDWQMLKNLRLERPIAFIDVETSGTNPSSDRVVELSVFKSYPDGREEYKSHRVNPGVPIPADATAVHGITDADVAGEPPFARYAKSIRDFLEGCDIAGFNVIKFDLPCLEAEFARAGVEFSRRGRHLVDSMVIYHQREPRDLQAAYRKYCGGEMKNAHRAEEDVKAAAAVLDGQLEMHTDLPRNPAEFCALCYTVREDYVDYSGRFVWLKGWVVCNFSKGNKGCRLSDIATQHRGFLEWIIGSDFPPEVKQIARNALDGKFPQKR